MAETFDASDDGGVQGAIAERGFAVIREAATAAELVRARELLWDHLASVGWERRDPTTWTDASFPGEGKEQLRFAMAGVLEGTPHIAANWYTRTLPGVLRGFASAYGTDDIVTAFGPMVINRPASTDQPSVAALANGRQGYRWDADFHQNVSSLHTHYNEDGCAPHHFRPAGPC